MRFAAAALAATVLIASPASAATIVQTVVNNNGPAYVQGFDPQVGTLNSVTVASSYFAWYYFEYASQLDDPVINVNGILGSPIFGTVDVSGLYQATRQGFNMIGVRLSGNATATTTSAFSPFYSPLVALLGGLQNGSFTVDGQPLKQTVPSFPGQAGGRFTVTYNYTPAVPEPGTWALMLAGFAMTGYALRRRRASVAFA